MKKNPKHPKLRIGLVVPHILIHRDIMGDVIFSPGELALQLGEELTRQNCEVTLFTPGPADTKLPNITADMSYFEAELAGRGDTYLDLLRKHPFIFVSLARQVQAELIAKVYSMANDDELDIIHIYTNEEDIALPFAKLCKKPTVFTHHDPFNFLIKYKSVFPKYTDLNWLSVSYAQRTGMPDNTNWIANIYHGLSPHSFTETENPSQDYVLYFGRIIEPKGVHLAIKAVKAYNKSSSRKLKLKIAGKHYSGIKNDDYWQESIAPELDDFIEFVGFIKDQGQKNELFGNALGLIIPSLFDEPFGMVMIEALACGTPILGLDSGAIPEIIERGRNGILVKKSKDEDETTARLASAIPELDSIDRHYCRESFEKRFTLEKMGLGHKEAYEKILAIIE